MSNYSRIFTGFMEMILEKMLKSNMLIVNSFTELDGEECIEHYEKTMCHKAWHIGLTSLIHIIVQEKAERWNRNIMNMDEGLSWLNTKQINYVLYIYFGSICYFSDK